MPQLTDLHLARIMRNASGRRRTECLQPFNDAMQANGIDTLNRAAAFVAQLAHESGELRWLEEIWGPTAAQKRYEPPSDLARRLGNTQKGDGFRYKGRGPIQITGRFNYRQYGELLGLDLEGDPAQAAQPAVGFAIAGCFWSRNGLNALADAGDFSGITRRINGGQNGAADRQRFHDLALQVLADSFPARAAAPAKAVRASRAAAAESLPRGQEAVEADAAAWHRRRSAPPGRHPARAGPRRRPRPMCPHAPWTRVPTRWTSAT